MDATAFLIAHAQLGEAFVVVGWFGLLALAVVGGVAYLRARR